MARKKVKYDTKGTYHCPACERHHQRRSATGRKHYKYKDVR